MSMEKFSIKTVNGDVLRGHIWNTENAKANLVVVTGMEEHSSRYDDFANFLNKNGINVVSVDHYGQGENVDDEDLSNLGKVPTSFFSKTVRAIDDIVKKMKSNGLPTYLFGHSMGSFMVQDYVQRFAGHVDKVVICGSNGPNAKTLFKFGFKLAKIVVRESKRSKKAKFMQRITLGPYAKAIKHRKTNLDWLSYNEDNVKKYADDPKCGYGSSNGFYYELLKGNARLYNKKFLKKVSPNTNIFIIAGEEDPVGAKSKGPKALYEMYKGLGVKNCELKLYKHMRHEILNENEKDIVYKDILNFFNV